MGRRIPGMHVDGKSWAEQAQDFILYYDVCSEGRSGPTWLLGMFMAKQWLRLINDPQPDVGEAKLMLKVLEAERPGQGSAWSDLYFRVMRWLGEVETPASEPVSADSE